MHAPHLQMMVDSLNKKCQTGPFNYVIPDYWNYFNIPAKKVRSHEMMVHPYAFFKDVIEIGYLNHKIDATLPLSKRGLASKKPGEWLKMSHIYSAMVRTTSAWDADRSGTLEDANIGGFKETGTFLKMLALLPRLKAMGINTMYLLPITEYSLKDKKGELGSPYGIKDLFKIDPLIRIYLIR